MAHGDVRYVPSDAGFKEMRNSPRVLGACLDAAKDGQRYGESIAPRDTGAYAASFNVRPTIVTTTGANPGPRVAAILENTSGHAAAVEWANSRTTRAHRVFARILAYLHTRP